MRNVAGSCEPSASIKTTISCAAAWPDANRFTFAAFVILDDPNPIAFRDLDRSVVECPSTTTISSQKGKDFSITSAMHRSSLRLYHETHPSLGSNVSQVRYSTFVFRQSQLSRRLISELVLIIARIDLPMPHHTVFLITASSLSLAPALAGDHWLFHRAKAGANEIRSKLPVPTDRSS